MAMFVDDGKAFGTTHMGGEGAQWAGMEPFIEKEHMFQNIGDGTFFHSGSLALRQALAAKSHITYKILYNRAVAMTGAQDPDGGLDLPELTKYLKSQGVEKVIITTDDTGAYKSIEQSRWDKDIEIMHRDKIVDAQKKLKAVKGVTVLIHDQSCAANLRRLRKRGLVHEPKKRIFINEAVCEGCGDCGVKSICLSVFLSSNSNFLLSRNKFQESSFFKSKEYEFRLRFPFWAGGRVFCVAGVYYVGDECKLAGSPVKGAAAV